MQEAVFPEDTVLADDFEEVLQLFPALFHEAVADVARVLLGGERRDDEALVLGRLLKLVQEPFKFRETTLHFECAWRATLAKSKLRVGLKSKLGACADAVQSVGAHAEVTRIHQSTVCDVHHNVILYTR